MSTISHTALSGLINSSPLRSPTSVKLLRFRRLTSGKLVSKVCETLGDDITTCIAGEDLPERVTCDRLTPPKAEDPNTGKDAPYLQILFLSSLRNERGCTTNQVNITPSTLLAICVKLGVHSDFLDGVLRPSIWSKQSGGCFHTYNDEGEVEAINGFYHYFNEWHLGPLHTWFQYQVQTKCTTYLLFNCPLVVKDKLIAGDFLPQPLSVDLLLAEECALWRESFIDERYKQIFNWHENTGAMDPPLNRHINAFDSMQALHQLSRTWNMMYEDLGDFEERLDFLISTSEKLSTAGLHTRTVAEHLAFVKARNYLRRRWVTSFGERTKLIINFMFNLANQEIARQARIETSSMMTIATLTMLFLPGAFVAAVLQVSNKLWQFFAITIPATILVLAAYQIWRRTREERLVSKGPDVGGDTLVDKVGTV